MLFFFFFSLDTIHYMPKRILFLFFLIFLFLEEKSAVVITFPTAQRRIDTSDWPEINMANIKVLIE